MFKLTTNCRQRSLNIDPQHIFYRKHVLPGVPRCCERNKGPKYSGRIVSAVNKAVKAGVIRESAR